MDCIETIHIFVAGVPNYPYLFTSRFWTQLKQGDPGCSYERRRCGFSGPWVARDFSGAWRIIPGLGSVVNDHGDRKSCKDRVVGCSSKWPI